MNIHYSLRYKLQSEIKLIKLHTLMDHSFQIINSIKSITDLYKLWHQQQESLQRHKLCKLLLMNIHYSLCHKLQSEIKLIKLHTLMDHSLQIINSIKSITDLYKLWHQQQESLQRHKLCKLLLMYIHYSLCHKLQSEIKLIKLHTLIDNS